MKDNINQKLIQITQMLCEVTNELMTASNTIEHKPTPKYKLFRSIRGNNKPHGNIGKVRSEAHKEAIANGVRKPFILTITQPNGPEVSLPFTGPSPTSQMATQMGITGRYVKQLKNGTGLVVRRRSTTKHPYPNGSIIKLTYLKK